MTDHILIFTFSPVQTFIAEARRAADLYTGSQILVRLAQSAARAIGSERLVYPSEITNDVPNKLVAHLRGEDPENFAEMVRAEFFAAQSTGWHAIVQNAKENFIASVNLPFDESIWSRQTADDALWEIYWSAASMDQRSYAEAYSLAESALIAAKRAHVFLPANEPGFKDTLSGKRQAIHNGEGGKAYWEKVGAIDAVTPIKIRPGGRERLDAIGIIKRFHPMAEKEVDPFNGFPSTSSIASLDFVASAQGLAPYAEKMCELFTRTSATKERKMRVRPGQNFPYDGDFLYPETLTVSRLQDDYGLKTVSENDLQSIRQELLKVYTAKHPISGKACGRPSPYYAIIVMDGDGMGEKIKACLQELNPEQSHKTFSQNLTLFSGEVSKIAPEYFARIIYNGGDDILAMCPLSTAYSFASRLASMFARFVNGTASAGIAITHHHSPLSAALRFAREAETQAKSIEGKNAVCIQVLRRSSEGLILSSKWNEADEVFPQLIRLFAGDETGTQEPALAGKLPYDLAASAYALDVMDEKFTAELKRLLKRHSNRKVFKAESIELWAGKLSHWAGTLTNNTRGLSDWLTFARFVAQGGGQ